ncbi:Variable outer membrane protein (plasmid) [Borrelia crocidurae DOU]|uniref:Variable large protein n=1 Tax=Borrelia crocidurae DOU TaxID=1293575 RepID=W5SKJ6_9SPIR|nr:Variable outer membrane protein [Borrelia crocidurae DOU]
MLDKIAKGAKEASQGSIGTGSELIGSATKNSDAVVLQAELINSLVKGIKTIVGVVLKDGEGNPEATKTGENENKEIGKLFGKESDATDCY